MKKRIINFIKYNRFFLALYKFFGNLFIKVFSLFIRVDDKKILFVSFGGRKFDDSPKALYEKIKNDKFFEDYKLVWAFINPKEFNELDCKKVKIDTLSFYKTALSSKIWITNSSIQRGLKLKRKNTIKINTWHGTPLKKLGKDMQKNKVKVKIAKSKGQIIYCAQSEYDREIFTRLFSTDKQNILLSDLPRNDGLLMFSEDKKDKIKQELGIAKDKKVILYAPTFREFNRDNLNNCYIKPPIKLNKWQEKLSNEYVLLFRAHYEVIKAIGITQNEFVIDVSAYPSLDNLMAISDLLISDYSSIYFDYSILEKPMLNFSYDYEQYVKERGLYLDVEKDLLLKINYDEDSLLNQILTLDIAHEKALSIERKKRFAPYAGNASNIVIDKLKQEISLSKW